MKKSIVLVFLIALLGYINVDAQFLSTEGKNIVNEDGEEILLRGMGLGGWMLMEGYMMQTASFANAQHKLKDRIEELIGEADTEAFFDAWLANHVTKADIDSLKSWGFNSVRLPMHYNLFTLPIEQEPNQSVNTWLDKGFQLTDQLIDWCAQNEMYVILDLHAAPGGQGYDEGISDYDPAKPSLWESEVNRSKTVALWARIAERYKDEPWVGGYDLINEPNWDIPGNGLLKTLYVDITNAIRAVDQNHIIFIEGNWFANDFTNLTPPWDDNMVYSPHKYWSVNDQASIQWVLNIREQHNVPLYLGESGENSNVWFRDAIKLFEDNNMGWAWWPMKKVESIAGPLSITKSAGYQALLDYWEGNGSNPGASAAKATLMDLADKSNISQCRYQKDVIDAMFRQVYSDETIPYNVQAIPGVVYATDYDMGIIGKAYHDSESGNYQVTTGAYTSWNNGWSYRNDGVDIEASEDNINSNGYNVGWIGAGEWLQYSVDVDETAVYDIEMRVAAGGSDGKFHFEIDGANISSERSIANTGGWQNWQTVTIPNIILSEEDKNFIFYSDNDGFNLSSFKFIKKNPSTALNTTFLSAVTLDENTVQVDINKPLENSLPASPSNFTINVNGSDVGISNTSLSNGNRSILIDVSHSFKSSEIIKVSYNGSQIEATDGTPLTNFTLREVENTIAIIHPIPGKIEAEDYFFQSGVQLENTSDAGGGQNIGFLDVGDYLDYYINVPTTGIYNVEYRTASESEGGAIQLQIVEADGSISNLHAVSFPPTGGWQTWTTTGQTAYLKEGVHQLRVSITAPLFNVNWFEFGLLTSIENLDSDKLVIYPNPSNGIFTLENASLKTGEYQCLIYDELGRLLKTEFLMIQEHTRTSLDLTNLHSGNLFMLFRGDDGSQLIKKVIKVD